MLCRVDGLRVWTDAFPPGVSSGCFAAVINYDFTSLLATIGLSSFVLGLVSWGYQVEGGPSCFLLFVCVVDFVGNPWITCESLYQLLCRSFGTS
jgi:hypothetical protein